MAIVSAYSTTPMEWRTT